MPLRRWAACITGTSVAPPNVRTRLYRKLKRNASITILVLRKDLDFVLALEPHNRLEERTQTRAYAFLLLRTKPRWARLYGQFPGARSLRQPQYLGA